MKTVKLDEKALRNVIKESVKKVIAEEYDVIGPENETPESDLISKNELLECLRDEAADIILKLGHNRMDAYHQGVFDGYKNVIKRIKSM